MSFGGKLEKKGRGRRPGGGGGGCMGFGKNYKDQENEKKDVLQMGFTTNSKDQKKNGTSRGGRE